MGVFKTQTEGLVYNTEDPGFCEANLRAEVQRQRLVARDDGRTKLAKENTKYPINLRGGYQEVEIDLADSRLSAGQPGIVFAGTCYEVAFTYQGTTPGAILSIDFQSAGGKFDKFQPGALLRIPGQSTGFVITRNPASLTEGSARIILARQPDVDYDELTPSPGQTQFNIPAGLAQLANSTANVPAAATDGLSLQGVTGIRAQVAADVGETITGGSVRLWYYNPTSGLWSPGPVNVTLPTGRRAANIGDYVVAVPYGRIFAEALSVTTSSGDLTMYLQTVGLG